MRRSSGGAVNIAGLASAASSWSLATTNSAVVAR
jgi:hypothetical protein